MSNVSPLLQAVHLLRDASTVVVLSGAGLSQASGIPTYRDPDGLWSSEEAVKHSTAEFAKESPREFSRFWRRRMSVLRRAKPNAGHRALVGLARRKQVTHITQNIDGLLTEAGALNVLELHGTFRRWRCDNCGRRTGPWGLWRCIRCFHHTRPDVVLFGEELKGEVLSRAHEACAASEVFILVGSSALVYPAADLPVRAMRQGSKLIVVNDGPLLLDYAADVVLRGKAEEVLPQLLQELQV